MATISERLREESSSAHGVRDNTASKAADTVDALVAALDAGLSGFSGMEDGDGNEAPELAQFRAALALARGEK